MKIAKRIDRLSPSITLSVTALAKKLKAEGKDILSFSAGEPDFDTPQIIKDAAIDATNRGFTKYTAVEGIIQTKEAIINKLKKDHNLDYKLENILISNGAKHSLFNLFQALVEEGDEVIIPAPYWVTYPEQVKYSNATPVIVETKEENDFKLTTDELKNAITEKTKVLILNSPSNPCGCVYTKKELEEIAEVLKNTNILIFSDEMYEKIIYDGLKFTATATINEDMFNRTITINGLSKAVAMTGWRFGYLATPRQDIIKAISKLQGQVTSNINSITQCAAIPALDGSADKDIENMRKEFEIRKNYVYEGFNKIKGLSCIKPEGAFYAFVNATKITNDSIKFCSKLLEEKGVAVVPGIGFGMEGYFRFSYASDLESIKKALVRIEDFINNYK